MARSPSTTKRHKLHMRRALSAAKLAGSKGEVPVGAVIIGPHNEFICAAHNNREGMNDPTAHAEVMALREAARINGGWSLEGHTVYVTLEPCPMCAGALVNARVKRLVFGCRDPKSGAIRSIYAIGNDPRLNHEIEVVEGVMKEECSDILKSFFQDLRNHLT